MLALDQVVGSASRDENSGRLLLVAGHDGNFKLLARRARRRNVLETELHIVLVHGKGNVFSSGFEEMAGMGDREEHGSSLRVISRI